MCPLLLWSNPCQGTSVRGTLGLFGLQVDILDSAVDFLARTEQSLMRHSVCTGSKETSE